MGTVVVLIVVVIIVIFVFIKKNGSSNQSNLVYIGKDSKGRPVFENRNINGTTSMWKRVENGKIEMNISDFNADRGNARFMPSENLRRYLVALEKGLVQARDNNGKFERASGGLVRYKDNQGNYVDNPDDYHP
jgi:hypothetical protein